MNAVSFSEKLLTVAEYIEFEEQSDIRHEYRFGHLYPIAGTSNKHNRVKQNVVYALRGHFLERGCVVFDENIKLQIIEDGIYNYPDVMLTCDSQDIDSEFIIKNPSLVVEVLSKSTARYDKTDKFEDFQKVASIQYYLIVESRWQSVILYSRTENPNLWTYQLFNAPNDVVAFPKLGFELSLETIYKYVNVPQFATISHYLEDDDEI
ncbi:MAG: Uma2 family endonuclease [Saprospiraceae bacterium]|nr:Uma2 family endonuclease [Saprospiraceae bacterium]